MDIKTLASYVGKTGIISVKGLEVEVTISDVKQSYGISRFLVSPVSGKGQAWVENVLLKEDYYKIFG
jgi:hypothetical protein